MAQPLFLWQHLGVVLQRCVTHAWCAILLDEETVQFLAVLSGLTWPQVPGMVHVMLA
jgi:hypothetical protein